LNLIPEATCIENHKDTSRLYKTDSLANSITLEKLLRTRNKGWDAKTRFTLGLILAYSLFYLYGGRWARGRWGRKTIIFHKNDHKIYLKPFLCSDPDISPGLPRADEGMHRFPEILELGVILLEIHIGGDLNSYSDFDPIADTEEPDALWTRASVVFDAQEEEILSLPYRHAIEWCLQSSYDFDIDEEDMAFQKLRTGLFQQVISPLECEIRRIFRDGASVDRLDEDEEAEKINLAPKTQTYSGKSSSRRPHDMTADDEHASKRHRPDDSQSTLPRRPETIPNLHTKPRSGVETSEGTTFSIRSVCNITNCAQKCSCTY
jgi:hypothetical protein